MFSPRLAGFLAVVTTTFLMTLPSASRAAQVCGCRNSKGRISRISQPPPPVTCPSTRTLVCWNEDPPPGDISARVVNSSSITVANNDTTILTFDTELWDTDNLHSTTTNTSCLTAPIPGKYLIFGHVQFSSSNAGHRLVGIRLNATRNLAQTSVPAVNNNQAVLSITTHYDLSANDCVELYAHQDSGGPLTAESTAFSPVFGMVKVP